MYFDFTEEHIMLQKMIREFTEKEITPIDMETDHKGEFPHQLFDKIKQNGLFGIPFPEKYGGSAGDTVATALALYEIAKGSASVAVTLDAHWLAADTILYHGTEEQKAKYLPRAGSDTIFAFALTEPVAGSDAAGIQTSAERDGDEWVLNGNKAWITNGGVAGVYIVLAKTDKTKGTKGISAFIIEEDNSGFKVGKKEDKMGIRGSQTTELILNNCRVGTDCLLGKEGDGFKIAMIALDGARISVGAIAAGMIKHAIKISVDYANERHAFGVPIANFQAIQFKLAEMASGLYATKLMTFNTAKMKDSGVRFSKEAAITKSLGSKFAMQAADEAIQIHGGYGYSREYPAEQLLRDAKLLQIGEGTTEILKMVIGKTELSHK